MRARIKEDPREWRKFILLACGIFSLVTGLSYWRGAVSSRFFGSVIIIAASTALLAIAKPELFGGIYRVAMGLSFRIGQIMGKVILGIFYLLILTPLAVALRIMRKDLLGTRIDAEKPSYWKEPRQRGKLDQQF